MTDRQNPHSAYRQSLERQSPTDQLVMLYDGVLSFVRQGKEAIEEKNWERRWNVIQRAAAVVNGLHEALDASKGGKAAESLSRFYKDLDARLVHIQCHNSLDACDTVIRDVKAVRDAWAETAAKQARAEEAALSAGRGFRAPDAVPTEEGDSVAEALAGLEIRA
jgi:flagellar protein FliS